MSAPKHETAAAAFVAAQREFAPLKKNAINPHFRNKYADLQACIESVQPALNKHGLALSQQTDACEDGVMIETVLLHESGDRISFGRLHVPAGKKDSQGYGSALTYARRYSVTTALGLCSEPDDDGNAASAPKKPAPKAADVAKKLGEAKDLPELAKTWASLSPAEKKVGLEAKNLLKSKLEGDEGQV